MLFHHQSFEERLQFFKLNICDFPESLTIDNIDNPDANDIVEGLKELRHLFYDIYSSPQVFKVEDTLKSLHNVTNTIMLLYALGIVGIAFGQGVKWYLKVDKKKLKGEYKSSINKHLSYLKEFGFYYEYYKNGERIKIFNRCTEFEIYCDDYDNAPLALSYIMKRKLELDTSDYARMQGLFYKLDYGSILLGVSTKRDEISPFREDILNTANEKRGYLEQLLKSMMDNYPLKIKSKFQEYYTPHWILQCYSQNKEKFALNINVAADTICVEHRMSIEIVEALAARKDKLTGNLKRTMDGMGCISCRNKCEGKNLNCVNGISYCKVYSEARLVELYIKSPEDVENALMVIGLEPLINET